MNVIAIRPPTGELKVPPEDNGELGTISLRWIIALMLRRWMLIAGTAIVVFLLLVAFLLLQKPTYTATALIMINPRPERVLTPEQMMSGGEPVLTAPLVDSQLEVLRSSMLAGRLVDAMNLVDDPDWNPSLRRAEATPAATPEAEAARRARTRQGIVSAVDDAIGVSRRGLTYAVEVSVTAPRAALAAEMANRLVVLFQDYQTEARFEAAARANEWLTARVEELRLELQRKEEAAERYRAEQGLISTQGALLSEQQTTAMQATLSQARSDLAEREARYAQLQILINSGGSAETIGAVLNSSVISQLRAQEAEVARRQADAETRYDPRHPTVLNVRAEREDIRNQISAEIGRLATSLRNEVEIARARVTALQTNLDMMRGQLVGSNAQMLRLRELEREAAAARSVYESFLARVHEIADQGAMRTNPAQLISEAVEPGGPSSPRLSMTLILALGLAGGLGMVAAFLAEALDESFNSVEDLERKTGVSVMASIPRVSRSELRRSLSSTTRPADFLIERQMSSFAEAFRVLRTTILLGPGQQKTQIVAITSALPAEGKTTTSLCLARVCALSGQRVMLIDCDLRRRSVKEELEIDPKVGLMQVLSGEVGWRQATYLDEASGMCVLPLSGSGFTPKEVFGTEDMTKLIGELRGSFDLIVLDCAPVLAVAETRVAVAMADSAVIVARWQKTPMRALRAALHALHDTGAQVRGIALNGVGPTGYYAYPVYDFSKA